MCLYSVWPLLKVKIFFFSSINNLANRVLFIQAAVLQQCSGKALSVELRGELTLSFSCIAFTCHLTFSYRVVTCCLPSSCMALACFGTRLYSPFWCRCRQINSYKSLDSAWRELCKSSNWAFNSLSQDVALFLEKKVQIESHSKTCWMTSYSTLVMILCITV